MKRHLLLLVACMGMLFLGGYSLDTGDTVEAQEASVIVRLSVSSEGVEGNNYSGGGAVSVDGRFVAFVSNASNLVPGDTNGYSDVFVRDLAQGTTERVSLTATGQQNPSLSDLDGMSGDAHYVGFSTNARLSTVDTDNFFDVYIRDRQLNVTSLVSVGPSGQQANDYVTGNALSPDGRYILLFTEATNWATGDMVLTGDIFVRDLFLETTTLASAKWTGGPGNNDSSTGDISDDGRFVVFASTSSNLTPDDTDIVSDIFLRDMVAGTTTLISVSLAGDSASGEAPSISADGRYIAFASTAANIVPNDSNGMADIFVYDRQTDTFELVSVTSTDGQANHVSNHAVVSSDGRYVSFSSRASNLVPGITNTDVFRAYLRDRDTGVTEAIAMTTGGAADNAGSANYAISPDGHYLVFSSSSGNLVANDNNGQADAFLSTRSDYVRYSIAGAVHLATGEPMAGVEVTVGEGLSTLTDGDGHFAFTGLPMGVYAIRPSKAIYTFSPPSLSVGVPPSAANVGFTGQPEIAPISIDFELTRDGYSFPNFNDPNGRDFHKEDLARMCGWEMTCANPQAPGASCQIKPEADKWLKNVADDAIGHCHGMATSALRFFTGHDQPSQFQDGAMTVFGINLAHSRRNITWHHVLQYLPNMMPQEVNPVAALQQVYQALQTGGGALVDLSVYDQAKTMGHTVLPYAIEDAGGGAWRILVYDNATPGDSTRYILVDTLAGTFSSNLQGGPGSWTGAMGIAPLDTYLQTPACNWTGEAGAQEATGYVSVLSDGLTGLLLTDDQNRRIGYVGGQIVNEIPGAVVQPLTGGGDVAHEPVYHLPAASSYSVELPVASEASSPPGSVSLYGAGYMLGVDGLVSSENAPDRLVFSADGDEIAFEAGEAGEVDLILVGGPDSNQAYSIRGADAGADGRVSLSQDATTGQVVVDYQNAATGWYTLAITNVTTTSEEVFFHSDIPVEAGDSHVVDINSLSDDFLQVCIDENSDGSLDECQELADQSPAIDSFAPAAAAVGAEIVVAGQNLAETISVTINGLEAAFTVVSDTALAVEVSAGHTTGRITVVTPAGTATSVADFTVIPAISSFSPTTGPAGSVVTISGTTLTGATAVTFNGVNAASFTVDSTTQITAVVPAGATTGKIAVTTPGGTATSAADFTVILPPTVTGFSPTNGPVGTSVTISGTAFSGATAVTFNGVSATSFTVKSATQITAVVPAGATTGKIALTTSGGMATSPADFTVTSAPNFPDVFYISPSANVTISGIAAQGADILRYTKSVNGWTMIFDGSNHGLTKNVSAFTFLDDGSLVFVLAANQTIAGLGTVTPYDVVRFTPTAPGVFPLGAGTYSWFLQGRPKGLTTTAEKIDAIDLAGNRLLLSTFGLASVPKPGGGVLKPADEDVFAFNLSTNAWESALVIDGSKMPGMGVEDINGIWGDPQSGDYYVTILGPFNLGGLAGNDKGIVKLTPNGGASVYTPSRVSWLAAGATLPTGFKIDGIEIAR